MFYLLNKFSSFATMSRSLKTWCKFSAMSKTGVVVNLRIVDMPTSLCDEMLNVYLNCFVKEEATFKAAGLSKSNEAIEELMGVVSQSVKDEEYHVLICCLDNGDDQIKDVIGGSIMTLISKDDPIIEHDFKTKEMKKLFEIIYSQEAYYDEMRAFNLDRGFGDRGIFVRPEYRGLGIAQQFLKVRRMICKEHGIPIHGAWMTSYGTQKAAERDGWETVFEIRNEELEKKHGVTFNKEPSSSKFMVARIKLDGVQ